MVNVVRGLGPGARRLWYINGKAYDLTPLLKWHPGGNDVLVAAEGRECTELFENSHIMSTKNIRAMLANYLVKDAPAGPQPVGFTFKDDGVYAELGRRVRRYFAERGTDHKATTGYWLRLIPLLATYALLMYLSLVAGYVVAAPLAGAVWMLVLFYGTLHDGSHQALSKRPWVNKMWSVVTNHWGGWHHEIWLQHHVYGHHSYTGVGTHDPDLHHFAEIFRKHRGPYTMFHRVQWFTYSFFFLLLPNQYVGQILAYWLARLWRSRVFEVDLRLKVTAFDVVPWTIEVVSAMVHLLLPFSVHSVARAAGMVFLHWLASGIMYCVIVAPNHDTAETTKEGTVCGDWGEHQIRHSSNFSHGSRLLTMLFGGMNYQIEHHLFPTVCNIHYPAISRIVKQVCAERNVPYVCFPSLWSALWSVQKNITALSTP